MAYSDDLNQLWRIWTLFDPRKALLGLGAALFALALFIHVVVLRTERFNWIEGATAPPAALHFLPPTVK